MNFNFEIEDMRITQKKTPRHLHEDLDSLFCSFVFTTPEWKHLEKYVIFWSRRGKSTIRYIGKGVKGKCPVPEMVLNDLYFQIQVYANDEMYTPKLKVHTVEPEKKHHHHHCDMDEIGEFIEKESDAIDKIVYENNKFLIFSNNKLVNSFDVVDVGMIKKILDGISDKFIWDTAISEDSDLPVANKTIYAALLEKADLSSLAPIAFTGSFNDLVDVPDTFEPSPHSHLSNDILDLEESMDEDINDFIDELIREIE